MRWLALALAIGCGVPPGGTTPRTGRVELRLPWEQGQHFDVQTTNDAVAGPLAVREMALGTLEVLSVADGVAEVRYTLSELRSDRPSNPVAIAPTISHPTLIARYRIDARGAAVGDPTIEDTTLQAPAESTSWVLAYAFSEPALPGEAVSIGDRWSVPSSFAPTWVGEDRRQDTRRSLRLTNIEDNTAHIDLDWDPVFHIPGNDTELRAHVAGRMRISVDGPLSWYGVRTLERYDPGTRRSSGAVPSARLQHEVCIAPDGTRLPCSPNGPEFPAPIEEDRPHAREYDAEACEARVARMRERMTAAQSTLRFDVPPEGLPASPNGHPITEQGIFVELHDGGWAAGSGGLVTTPADLGTHLDALARERALSIPTGSRMQIYLRAPDERVLAPLRAAWSVLRTRGDVVLLVAPPTPDIGLDSEAPPYVRARWARLGSAADDSERTTALGEMASQAITTCVPVANTFVQAAQIAADSRAALIAQQLPDGIAQCGCGGVDVDMLDAFATANVTRHGTPAFGVTLTDAIVNRIRPTATLRALLDSIH